MIPGITPAIITRAASGPADGYFDDFLTDTTVNYTPSIGQSPDPEAGIITYNAIESALDFVQSEAWSGIATPDFPVIPGADYEVIIDSHNLGPTGQAEGYIRSGIGGAYIATMSPRQAAYRRDTISSVVTATSDLMAVFWEIRGGGSSSFRIHSISATRL